jgi:hypothetical protein
MTSRLEVIKQQFTAAVIEYAKAHPEQTLIEIGKELGCSSGYVSVTCKKAGMGRKQGRGSTSWKRKPVVVVAPAQNPLTDPYPWGKPTGPTDDECEPVSEWEPPPDDDEVPAPSDNW